MKWAKHARMLTVVEMAAYLDLTPGAVRKTIRKAGIKPEPVRFGRHVLYDSGEVFAITGTGRRRARLVSTRCGR